MRRAADGWTEAMMLQGLEPRGYAHTLGQIIVVPEGQPMPPPEQSPPDEWQKQHPDCNEANNWCGSLGPADTTGGGGTPPPTGTTPGAVPVTASNWDLTTTPARYQLAAGDTLVGLAITYLGDGNRWGDIWQAQDASYRQSHSPDHITAGDWLNMPDEATANFKAWVQKGKPTPTPGQLARQQKSHVGYNWKKILAYGTAIAVGGTALYYVAKG